ncbi:hypothetical protein FACS1894151_04960 [Spirochaetia bacterium]|nr:hypothetical protein FACS1894151_04960 [Spirochaetia bacterium]
MSKLHDFYRKAGSDSALKADLEAVKKRYEGQSPDKATVVAEYTAIAAKHGVTLEADDFELAEGELDEEELSAVAGGAFVPKDIMPLILKWDSGKTPDTIILDGPPIRLA